MRLLEVSERCPEYLSRSKRLLCGSFVGMGTLLDAIFDIGPKELSFGAEASLGGCVDRHKVEGQPR